MITFKLVKVEDLKLVSSVELSDSQLDIIYDALNEYQYGVDDEEIQTEVDNIIGILHTVSIDKV